jgi:phosphatidylglycerophosphate synthase
VTMKHSDVAESEKQSFADVYARLASAQKPTAGAPAYSRFVNRPVGRYLAVGAHRVGLSPNQVTGISACCTGAGIVLLALVRPSILLGALVAGLLMLGYALDSADGQVARLRGVSSMSGEWLDHFIDAGKIASLHLAVLISVYRFADLKTDTYLLIPLLFSVVAVVLFFGMTLNDLLARIRAARLGVSVQPRPARSPLRSLLGFPTDYGTLCLMFLLLGWPMLFRTVYALIFAANVLFLALASVKWFRDMGRLDASA